MNADLKAVTTPEACKILHCGRSHFYECRAADPNFPRPFKLARANLWHVADLEAYLALRISRQKAAP